MKKLVYAGLFAFCLPLAQAETVVRMPVFKDVVVLGTNVENAAEKTRQAVIQGAKVKNWRLVSKNENTLRLRLDVRKKHMVIVDVRVHGGLVDVEYVRSTGLDYDKDHRSNSVVCGMGETATVMGAACSRGEVIHPGYGRWVRGLLDAVNDAASWLDETVPENGAPEDE